MIVQLKTYCTAPLRARVWSEDSKKSEAYQNRYVRVVQQMNRPSNVIAYVITSDHMLISILDRCSWTFLCVENCWRDRWDGRWTNLSNSRHNCRRLVVMLAWLEGHVAKVGVWATFQWNETSSGVSRTGVWAQGKNVGRCSFIQLQFHYCSIQCLV